MEPRSDARRTWVVVERDLAREAADQVCVAVLDVLAESAPWAHVDAWSDHRDELPPHVEQAQVALRGLHAQRDGLETGMGIDIDRTAADQELLLRTYAAWSIHVELLPAPGYESLAVFHDGACSITADLTDAEVRLLRRRLDGIASMDLLEDVHARAEDERKGERRRQRAEWVRRLLGRRG